MTPAFWAAHQADVAAVISPHGDRTFGELNANANRLARALRARGVGPDDGVALMVSNRPEFVEVVAAVQRIGARLTPINWHLTAEEAAYIVDDCEAAAFVADARFAGVAADAGARAGAAPARLAVGGPIAGFEDYPDALAAEDPADIDDPIPGRTMFYTSGTTGRPKGVHRTEDPPRSDTAVALLAHPVGESLHLCTGPLYHAAPFSFSLAIPLVSGCGVVLMDAWSPEETLRLITEHHVTHTHLVPIMFHRLLAVSEEVKAQADVSSLRLVLHGAAPCPVPVKQAIIDWWGPVVVEYYAATEGVGTWVTSEEWLRKPGTVGRPAEVDHIRILDDTGASELPPGEVGTVFLKAPTTGRFDYFKDPDKTEGSYRDDYYTMGDVGFLDEDGYLFLTDRSANLIISGGVNIYPAEVEAELVVHPAVADVAVIGVPDDEWGESVLAVVELRPGQEASDMLAAELIEHCRARLARFKCPKRVDFIDQLPRSDAGKLYKRRLRDQYRAPSSTQ
jgi:long-chain acyl-CoA synthetase